jgi:spore coat protein A
VRLSRRNFFGIAGSAGLVAATASLGLLKLGPTTSTGIVLRSEVPLPQAFSQPLAFPDVLRPSTGRIALTQQMASVEIVPGLPTQIWGFNGTFPGPTIAANSGQPLTVDVRNELPVPTVVHLHGGRTPPESDGYPTDLILPAGSATDWASNRLTGTTAAGSRKYHYPLNQRAATLWYHDHTMDFTGPNVYRGLAGFFLVSDAEEENLPLPRGDRDLPLMICDRAFAADGAFAYPATAPDQSTPGVQGDYVAGVLGDVLLVNGVPWPRHQVDGAQYRMRLLNASNARRYEFALDPPPPSGAPFVQIATDHGLLTGPVSRNSVTLAPAERAEVIVDFSQYPVGSSVTLVNRLGEDAVGQVMRFDIVRAGANDDATIPRVLSRIEPLDPADAVITRTFAFQLRRPLTPVPNAGHAGHAGSDDQDNGPGAMMWTVNGQPFNPSVDLAAPRLGDIEIWRLMTDLHHPVHVHLAPFQVLRRGGKRPGEGDLGWKDTIDLHPGETAEIILRFDGYRGRYVFHCHNLEHEDMMMMANFTVG